MNPEWENPEWERAVRRLSPLVKRFGFVDYNIDVSDISTEKINWLADKLEEREIVTDKEKEKTKPEELEKRLAAVEAAYIGLAQRLAMGGLK